jgi:alkylhydroperoxidase family enzyme
MRLRPFRWLAMRYARLRFGKAPEPMTRWAEHGGVFWAWSVAESIAEVSWRTLPTNLHMLATLKSASTIDCPWCLDFGSHLSEKSGLDEAKLRDLHRWQTSDAYDETERDVLAYAEGVTATPVHVDDSLTDRLRSRLGEKGMVELTALVALENQRSRFNAAMGVLPQGWSRVCALATPGPTPATGAGQEVTSAAAKSSV